MDLDPASVAAECTRILFENRDDTADNRVNSLSNTWRAYKQRLRQLNSPQISLNYEELLAGSKSPPRNAAASPDAPSEPPSISDDPVRAVIPLSLDAMETTIAFLQEASSEALSAIPYDVLATLGRLAEAVNDRLQLDDDEEALDE